MTRTFLVLGFLCLFSALSAQTVKQLSTAEFKQKIFNYDTNKAWKSAAKKPVIIDFYADWCGPCKMLGPNIEAIAKKYGNQIEVYKVNVDNNKELSAHFNITGIPYVLFIPVKGPYKEQVGYLPADQLQQKVTESLGLK